MNGRFVVLLEHQSTINENMPLRFLIYIARLYEKIIDVDNIYRKRLLKIPTPEFTVLYNGSDDLIKDGRKVTELELRLSDAFKEEDVQLELKVKVIDIRYPSHNKAVTKSDTLEQYSRFIQIVEDCRKQEKNLDKAMKKAIDIAIEKGILKEFLIRHSAEVRNMLTLEYNEEVAKRVEREEALEEGRLEGERKGSEETRKLLIINNLQKGRPCDIVAEFLDVPIEEVEKIKDSMQID